MKKIEVKKGQKKRIADIFGVSHVTVKRALNFETKTELADKIRACAIRRGGKIYESN